VLSFFWRFPAADPVDRGIDPGRCGAAARAALGTNGLRRFGFVRAAL